MFFSQLLALNDTFSPQLTAKLDTYIASLSPAAQKLITAHKVSLATGTDYSSCLYILKACIELGLMHKRYAIRCPNCNGYLKIADSLSELAKVEEAYCSRCDEIFPFDDVSLNQNVELVFSLDEDKFPFVMGQQLTDPSLAVEGQAVAPKEELKRALAIELIRFDEMYALTEDDQRNLLKCIQTIRNPKEKDTTTAIGASLEDFTAYLFERCTIFRVTTKFKTKTNQIDGFVKVADYVLGGLFGIEGNTYFAIECKNEKKAPKGDYLSKLHSILRIAGGKLGIVVSKKPAPSTYAQLAHDYYLKDDMYFVWFNLDELENMISEEENLVEAINTKVIELKTNAAHPLSCMGL